MLGKRCFSSAHVAGYYDALCHAFGAPEDEAEEFQEKAVLSFAVRQLLRYVVYVQLRLVSKYAAGCHYGFLVGVCFA